MCQYYGDESSQHFLRQNVSEHGTAVLGLKWYSILVFGYIKRGNVPICTQFDFNSRLNPSLELTSTEQ